MQENTAAFVGHRKEMGKKRKISSGDFNSLFKTEVL
jgi:hypothetical protein